MDKISSPIRIYAVLAVDKIRCPITPEKGVPVVCITTNSIVGVMRYCSKSTRLTSFTINFIASASLLERDRTFHPPSYS